MKSRSIFLSAFSDPGFSIAPFLLLHTINTLPLAQSLTGWMNGVGLPAHTHSLGLTQFQAKQVQLTTYQTVEDQRVNWRCPSSAKFEMWSVITVHDKFPRPDTTLNVVAAHTTYTASGCPVARHHTPEDLNLLVPILDQIDVKNRNLQLFAQLPFCD